MTQSFDILSKNHTNHVNGILSITGCDPDQVGNLHPLLPDLVARNFNLLDFEFRIGNLYESAQKFFPKASYMGSDNSEESIH
jgi:hypothetical protein